MDAPFLGQIEYSMRPHDANSTIFERNPLFKGWFLREFYTRTGQKLEHIKSPTGAFFPGRFENC